LHCGDGTPHHVHWQTTASISSGGFGICRRVGSQWQLQQNNSKVHATKGVSHGKICTRGDFETSGEGSTLFKFIRAGLKLEKASFKNWWLSGGWKKVRSQINKQRNTIQDALK
jgi:hypothetical protein